jgi:hypothetical protein
VADRVGVPVSTLRDAEQHVAAVEEFPELAGVSQHEALEVAQELRQAPKEKQMAVRAAYRTAARAEPETCTNFVQVAPAGRGPATTPVRTVARTETRTNLAQGSGGGQDGGPAGWCAKFAHPACGWAADSAGRPDSTALTDSRPS